MSCEPLAAAIQEGCIALDLHLEPAVVQKLCRFVELLEKWNRVYNLTSVRDPQAMVTRHILDSLAVMPFLTTGRLLDVGTGAGLPGLPIALVRTDLSVTLLDSNAKKLRFVRQAVAELGVENVEIIHQRLERYRPAQAFDMVISRAVSSLRELYDQTSRLVKPGGRFLIMKGARPNAEIEAFMPGRGLRVETLQVPGLEAERHLLWCEKRPESGSISV
jgi:16S rRNA (guanine527-N7)-methyltransferase